MSEETGEQQTESLESCIMQHMEEDDMTRQEAREYCRNRLNVDQSTIGVKKAFRTLRELKREEHYNKSKIPRAKDTFQKLQKKRLHWIDKRPH